MEFDLKYRGLLPAATGSNKQVPGKHHVRQVVREQLEVLWAKDSRFTKIDPSKLQRGTMKEGRFDVQRPIGDFPAAWLYHHEVRGIQFVPLITHIREARCRLAIRLFRRHPRGEIIARGGDLDNRLKTLFDALRMPHSADELPDGVPGPSPFLCLLDDDALITKVSIETFGLLTPPGPGEDADYVELDIGVDVVPVTPMWATLDWLFP